MKIARRFSVIALTLLAALATTAFAQDEEATDELVPTVSYTLVTATDSYNGQSFVGINGDISGVSNPILRANVGDVVEIILINGDGGSHDIYIEALGVQSERVARADGIGNYTTVVFEVTEAGIFEYICSIGRHAEEGMIGHFIVGEAAETTASSHEGH